MQSSAFNLEIGSANEQEPNACAKVRAGIAIWFGAQRRSRQWARSSKPEGRGSVLGETQVRDRVRHTPAGGNTPEPCHSPPRAIACRHRDHQRSAANRSRGLSGFEQRAHWRDRSLSAEQIRDARTNFCARVRFMFVRGTDSYLKALGLL